jgi:hypothetical protein
VTGTLFTFGYGEIADADALRRLIGGAQIADVVDVRLRPFGRSPFNGPTASRALTESLGLSYRWDQRLGNLAYRAGGIEIKDVDAIEDVLDALRAGRSVALMCGCPRPEDCHRLTLCEEAVRRMPGLKVVHLPRRPAAFLARDASDEQIEAFVDALLLRPPKGGLIMPPQYAIDDVID